MPGAFTHEDSSHSLQLQDSLSSTYSPSPSPSPPQPVHRRRGAALHVQRSSSEDEKSGEHDNNCSSSSSDTPFTPPPPPVPVKKGTSFDLDLEEPLPPRSNSLCSPPYLRHRESLIVSTDDHKVFVGCEHNVSYSSASAGCCPDIEIVYDYTRPSFLFRDESEQPHDYDFSRLVKCSLGNSTAASSSEDLLSDSGRSEEGRVATELLTRNVDSCAVETMSSVLSQQLRFMRYQPEQFWPLLRTGCFKQVWKQGDFIYRTGDKESHCVILYSGEIVEIKNIYEGSSGNNNTTQLRKHHRGPVVFGVGALMLPETRSSCIQVSSLEGAETYMLHQKTFQKFWQETSKLSYKTILNSLQHFHFFTCLDGNEQDKLILASEELKFDCFSQVVHAGSPLNCFYVALQGHFFKFEHTTQQQQKKTENAAAAAATEGEATTTNELELEQTGEGGEQGEKGLQKDTKDVKCSEEQEEEEEESVPGLSAFNLMGLEDYSRGCQSWNDDWWAEGNSVVLKFDFKKVENLLDIHKLLNHAS